MTKSISETHPIDFLQDYIYIRKGTRAKSAFNKSMKTIWNYILHNSKNLETETGITIRLERKRERD